MIVEGTKTFGAGSTIEEANQNGTKGTPCMICPKANGCMEKCPIARVTVSREKNQDSVI